MEYTRDTLRDLIMSEAGIPKTLKALGLFYVNTISDDDIGMIGEVAPIILENLKTGKMEEVIETLEAAGVPPALLSILKVQADLYATKISNDQAI